LVFTDGNTILPLVSSQDHKRVFDNDQGPNTGGMGAYSPAPLVTKDNLDSIIGHVFGPVVSGLKREGKIYKGLLYGGLMIKDNIAYVLEFNVRFGDPETQAILPKLKSDLVEVMLKTIDGKLDTVNLQWDDDFCVCVVLTSGGYPGAYEKGKLIKGLDGLAPAKDVFVFHAGTKKQADSVVTSGGRVLNVVALGKGIKDAQEKAYKAISSIKFDNMFYRRDIANKAL
ncbi:MAG: phosphoribosylamine--glycine ligase, partial [Candidatus Omnitrophica bacterium]|nr:phosphoribosylamine--glycine ligase [Candidatus Omnitrophota bacterium]